MNTEPKRRTLSKGISDKNIIVVCHNIRSALNVGSVFRTADGAGAAAIFLTGYTPTPPHPGISKTALGAEKFVAWKKFSKFSSAVEKLKKNGYEIIALEQDKKSVDLSKFKTKKNTALVIGNEVKGLSPASLKKCDKSVEIPMYGEKESLNVSVAFGIAIYAILS